MSIYLDASVLVSFFVEDTLTAPAERFMRGAIGAVVISDFAVAEFASAINRRVRTRRFGAADARATLADFDAWVSHATGWAETMAADVAAANSFLRRLDLNLRTPDAIHIAIAQRLDAELATFDATMAASAKALGTRLSRLPR